MNLITKSLFLLFVISAVATTDMSAQVVVTSNINSGSNTVSIVQWGQNGDIPVDGDFDGDGLADQAIFRPSLGQWWLNRSTAGTLAMTFGANGDKPVTGDYDKDGKTDVALWRPSSGEFLILRSSSNFTTFFGYPFGTAGDIPVQGGAQ